MPDIAVHTSMGEKVYNMLNLNLNRQVFQYGLLGPDPLLFGMSVFSGYSSVMHRQHTGDFLLEMARRCRLRDEFSYLAGFLCHYALDTLVHPYIIETARQNITKPGHLKYMHIAIEQRLDVLDGGNIKIPEFPPESVRSFFNKSVESVYGWKNTWNNLKHNYWVMKPFYAVVGDRYGILDRMLGWMGGPPSMFSYKSHVCEGIDLSSFYPLYDASIDDAVRYITCADAFVRGRIGEDEFREIIGDKPYL